MSRWSVFTNVWKNIQEVDLRPIRQAAERPIRLALAGMRAEDLREWARYIQTDPFRPEAVFQSPLIVRLLEEGLEPPKADLTILAVDSQAGPPEQERKAAESWTRAGYPVVVAVTGASDSADDLLWGWGSATVAQIPAHTPDEPLEKLIEAVLAAFPLTDDLLALGRQYPFVRATIARRLISETSYSNAVYALSTGLAEVIPVLDLPLNIADIIVLSKAQALLVYRLGLVLGLPAEWRYYLAEFGGVVGGGFLWRQIARQLVGLIPVWGIVPKVAVAYAGTYVVGNIVVRWYQTGRHVTRKEISALYRQAFSRGRELARTLTANRPRPRLFRRTQTPPEPEGRVACPRCGAGNDPDAHFCKKCGNLLADHSAD